MIIDSRIASETGEYDILIVGAGPAGIAMANELDGTGLRVALLESGGEEFDGDTQELYDGDVTGLEEEFDLTASRLRFLGGTSNHWGGRCVPLDPIDFARAPFSGLTGWPISREELLRYYPRANTYCGVGEFEYEPDAATGMTAEDFLMPADSSVEAAIVRQSSVNFGETYRDALRASDNVHLWLWANLTGLGFSSDGTVEGVQIQTLDGQVLEFRAPNVVLACGAIENARILMLANRANATTYGDAGGLLGAGYMDHPAGGAAFLHPTQTLVHNPHWDKDLASTDGVPLWLLWRLRDEVLDREGLANGQFYLLPFRESTHAERDREAKRGMVALRQIAKWAVGHGKYDFSLSDSYCEFILNTDAMAATTITGGWGEAPVQKVLLKYEAEQQPTRDNRVTLGERPDRFGQALPVLHWAPGEFDRDSLLRTTTLIGAACGRADIGRVELEPNFEKPYFGTTTSWHQIGTTRMSEAASDGVTDPDGRVHGTTNLYMVGGSVMPTSGRANPTLTIVALTLRLTDHLKAKMET